MLVTPTLQMPSFKSFDNIQTSKAHSSYTYISLPLSHALANPILCINHFLLHEIYSVAFAHDSPSPCLAALEQRLSCCWITDEVRPPALFVYSATSIGVTAFVFNPVLTSHKIYTHPSPGTNDVKDCAQHKSKNASLAVNRHTSRRRPNDSRSVLG